MNTQLGLIKISALAVCCAFGFGMTQLAHADSFSIGYNSGGHWGDYGHGGYNVSVGVGSPGYYGGYYAPRPRYHYAPSYSYYAPDPYYSYGDDGSRAFYDSSYYGGYGYDHGYDHDYDRGDYDGDDRYAYHDNDRGDYDRDDYDYDE